MLQNNQANLALFSSIIFCASSFMPAAAQTDARDNNLIKVGAVALYLNDESGDLAGDPALTPPGVTVDVEDTAQLAGSYTRFIGDHFGLEFFLGLPFTLEINGDGAVAGAGKVAEVDVLAPTLLANYYFTGRDSKFRPYVSLAFNFAHFYNADATPALQGLLSGETDLSIDNSYGLGGFVGFNHQLRDNFYISGLLGYVDVDADTSLLTNTVADLGAGPVSLGQTPRTIDVELDPTVLMLTAGYSF